MYLHVRRRTHVGAFFLTGTECSQKGDHAQKQCCQQQLRRALMLLSVITYILIYLIKEENPRTKICNNMPQVPQRLW